MNTNAEKISAWRQINPGTALNGALLCELLSLTTLRDTDLSGADLRDANLTDADLTDAKLTGTTMRNADLTGANLRDANLRDADLRGANLRGSDLTGANLWGANLRGANLWGGLPISTPSGEGYLIPTPDGWRITIGCWNDQTLEDLRDLIADKTAWPEATGEERERRRPILAAVLALAEAHTEYHAHLVPTLAKKWGTK